MHNQRKLTSGEQRAQVYAALLIPANIVVALTGQLYLQMTWIAVVAIALSALPALIIYSLHQKPAKNEDLLRQDTGLSLAFFAILAILAVLQISIFTPVFTAAGLIVGLFVELWLMFLAVTFCIWESGKLPQEQPYN